MSFLNVIIVNWNAGETLHTCLQSVFNSTLDKSRYHVFVVDNNSIDNSIDLISGLSTNLTIIVNKVNIGFGGACNMVLEDYPSEFVLLLNPDVIINRDTLSDCLAFIEQNPDIDVLGVKNFNLEGKVVASCARFPSTGRYLNDMLGFSKIAPKLFIPGTAMSDWNHLESREVDHVIGAYMMIRYSVVKNIDFFDKDFFLYMEDVDLSYRIKKTGGKIFYNSNISIIHEGGGTTKSIKATRLYYSLQSRLIFCFKHFNFFSTSLIILVSTTIEPLIRLLKVCISFKFQDFISICTAYGKYYFWLLSLLHPNKVNVNSF